MIHPPAPARSAIASANVRFRKRTKVEHLAMSAFDPTRTWYLDGHSCLNRVGTSAPRDAALGVGEHSRAYARFQLVAFCGRHRIERRADAAGDRARRPIV